jgi:hypothetical protein
MKGGGDTMVQQVARQMGPVGIKASRQRNSAPLRERVGMVVGASRELNRRSRGQSLGQIQGAKTTILGNGE